MHRLHKADVRQHRFLMRGQGVGHQRRGANGILDGIEQRQAVKTRIVSCCSAGLSVCQAGYR
jgi:hypothetical protein